MKSLTLLSLQDLSDCLAQTNSVSLLGKENSPLRQKGDWGERGWKRGGKKKRKEKEQEREEERWRGFLFSFF